MSVGQGTEAIASLLRLPRPRRYRPLWIALGVSLALTLAFALALAAAPSAVLATLLAAAATGAVVTTCLLVGRLWSWIAAATALGLGLGAVPLFDVLGFELALAAALFAAPMGLDLGAALARELQRIPPRGIERAAWPVRALARSTATAALVAVGVAAIPAAIAALRGLWRPTCDWSFGVAAYVALPLATAALAGALGHAVGVVAGPRRFLGAALAQVPLVVVAAAAFWRFYTEPPVFTYNAVLGYFPGNLYDEHVQLDMPLLWSRLEQALVVVAVVALVATRLDVASFRARLAPRPAGRRLGAAARAATAAALALALHYHAGDLGYAIDDDDIVAALGGRRETPHFVIYYARTPELEAEIDLIARDHEYRYAQVVAQTGLAPAHKLRSFYFASREQKYALFGARDVEMSKPWLRDIYLDHRPFPHGSLRHEIAHAIASAFGDPYFGVAARRVLGVPVLFSPGLIEGLAVALDWPGAYDRPNPHEAVRVMQATAKLPRLDALFGLQFFQFSSARGYMTAGSFLRFLLDRHGAARLRALYASGGDFEHAYGLPLARLEAEWGAMLATLDVPPAAVAASAERFRGGSVFARPCPHAIAARRERAMAAAGAGDRAGAVRLMRRVCDDAPEEPRYQLELGDALVPGPPTERAEAEALWRRVAGDEAGVTSTLRAQAFERLARLTGTRGALADTRALVAAGVALPLEPHARRTLDAMAFALAHDGPAGEALRGYFFPRGFSYAGGARTAFTPLHFAALAAIAEPELGLGHYLLGLQRLSAGDRAAAIPSLARALERGLPGLAFTKNAARQLAVTAYRVGDRAALDAAIAALTGPDMTSGDRALAADWQARLAFDATATATAATSR